MIIESRNYEIKYPKAIREDKRKLVLDWLLEFRFSSFEVLSKRIDSTVANSNRFFNQLIDEGVIQVFKNIHTNNARFVMLARPGVTLLESMGRDVGSATTRVANLGRYTQVLHDLCVQHAVLEKIQSGLNGFYFDRVVWDRNINVDVNQDFDRPDAILYSGDDLSLALEYERWRKDSKRVYQSFIQHKASIERGFYSGVAFLFDKESDKKYYQKLFSEYAWPEYRRNKKTGKMYQSGTGVSVDKVSKIRKFYIFEHFPVAKI